MGSGSWSGSGADGNTAVDSERNRSRRRGVPGTGSSARIAAFTSGSAMRCARSGGRKVRDRVVGGPAAEDVRGAQAAQQALAVTSDLGRDAARRSRSLPRCRAKRLAPRVRPVGGRAHRERHPQARLAGEGTDPVDLAIPRGAVAPCRLREDRGEDRVRRRRRPRPEPTRESPRCRRRCRALRARRLPCASPAGSRIGRRRRLRRPRGRPSAMRSMSSSVAGSLAAPRSPITNARTAPCAICAATSRARRDLVEGIEVFADRFPVPVNGLPQRCAGDAFHAFHETDEPVVAVGRRGGKAHTAVAHDHGGDAVPDRRQAAAGSHVAWPS